MPAALIVIVLLGVAAVLLGAANMSQPNTSTPPPAPSPQVLAMAQAIARQEGSNPAWNNPGDLTIAFGYPTNGVANSDGVLIFTNPNDGWSALYKQLQLIIDGKSRYSLTDTIATLGAGYSGGDPQWAVNVASFLGVTPDTQLGDVLS